jgi:MFS transporter, DHA1 family, multidrug resistance protein
LSQNRPRDLYLILILGALTALGPFSIDMYLPAFPKLAEDLSTNISQVSLSLSSFFVGLAAGQLFYGPLLDRFGRKPPLCVGLVLYILASIGCLSSRSIEVLIAFRFVQAIGGCAAGVASVAMVRDFFSLKDSAKVFSLLVLILGVSPLIAPTAGGYLAAAFGWQSVFVVLAIIGALMLAMILFWLPESHTPDRSYSLRLGPIFKTYAQVLQEPQFYTYTLVGALALAGLFVYVGGSPVLFMEIFRVSERVYGWIFAALSIGFIGASQVNVVLLRRYRNDLILQRGLACQMLTGFVFLVGALAGWYGLRSTIALLFMFLCSVGFIMPNASSLALAPFSRNTGSASALMGSLQMAIGALATVGVSLLHIQSSVPVAALLAVSAVIGWLVLTGGRRKIVQPIDAASDAPGAVGH